MISFILETISLRDAEFGLPDFSAFLMDSTPDSNFLFFFWLCWGLTTRQPLRVILCCLPEKGRKEIEELVEEMKAGDREERGTGMKVKKQKK